MDESGVVKQRAGYATWGGKTQVQNSDARAEDRGYTGHEHLVEVDLIHMNGRVYDPGTGRFLSADPLIQDPYDGQSYNRYSYVRNNPLSFTDPSGYSWWTKWRKPIAAIAVAAIIRIAAGMIANSAGIAAMTAEGGGGFEAALAGAEAAASVKVAASIAGGFAAGGIQGGNIESAVAGALSAGLFYAAGSIAEGAASSGIAGFGRGEIGRVALHAVAGCAGGAAAGGSCGKQAAAGAFSELAGLVIDLGGNNVAYRIAAHAIAGGLGSMAAGGKFENGAVTGAFGYLFNCGAHDCWQHKNAGLPSTLRSSMLSIESAIATGGDEELATILRGSVVQYSDVQRYNAGRVVYADARDNTVTLYPALRDLAPYVRDFALLHEFSHRTQEALSVGASDWDHVFRTRKALTVEAIANSRAQRVLGGPIPHVYQDAAR